MQVSEPNSSATLKPKETVKVTVVTYKFLSLKLVLHLNLKILFVYRNLTA